MLEFASVASLDPIRKTLLCLHSALQLLEEMIPKLREDEEQVVVEGGKDFETNFVLRST